MSSSLQKVIEVGPVSFSGNLMPNFFRARVIRVFLTTSILPPVCLILALRSAISLAVRP